MISYVDIGSLPKMRNHEHPGTSETKIKCIVCKAVDRKRALSERKNKIESKLLEKSARENEWCETIRRMFSPSAKLDYRFVVQVIRSLLLLMPFSSVANEHIYSYLHDATPGTRQHTNSHSTLHLFVPRIRLLLQLYSHVQLALYLCYSFYLFICIFASIVLMISAAEAKENPNNRNADEKTRMKIIIWFRFVAHFLPLFTSCSVHSRCSVICLTSLPRSACRCVMCRAVFFFGIFIVARFVPVILFCTFSIGLYWIGSFVWQKRSVKWRRSRSQSICSR